ncbi:MAG TPA: glycosyltransferase 87 family protein [Rhizomicrobium sp.]
MAAALCFLPVLAIALLSGWQADRLAPLFSIAPTNNLAAVRAVLRGFLHLSDHGDSWLPMRHALDAVKGADRDALYESLFFRDHVRFQYPPSSLLALDLLSGTRLASVRGLNALNTLIFVFNAAAVSLLSWLLFRTQRLPTAAPYPRAMALIAAGATFLFYPLLRAHLLGQIQLWIDLLFSLAVIAWFLQRRFLAGLCIGVACSIKPQLGLLLLWGLLWREHSFTAGIIAALAPLLGLSLLFYGIHNHVAYLDVMSFLSRHGESYFANNSVNGILNWYLSPDDSLHWYEDTFAPYDPLIYGGTMAASLLALVLVIAPPLLEKRRAALTDLGAAAICSVVGSPVAWEHHYGILLPLYLIALYRVFDMSVGNRRRLAIITLTLSWILVANFIPFASLLAHTYWVALQAYCFFGALLLLAFFLIVAGGPSPPRVVPP